MDVTILRRRSWYFLAAGLGMIPLAIFFAASHWEYFSFPLAILSVGGVVAYVVTRNLIRRELARQEAGNVTVGKKPTWRTLAGIVIAALIIALLLLSSGEPSTTFLLGWCGVVSVLMAAMRMRGKPAVAVSHLVAAAIYIGVAVAATQYFSIKVKNDADIIANKLEEYKQQVGDYPDRLDALVPAMLPEIPKPRPTGFLYFKSEDSYTLYYRTLSKTCFYRPGKAVLECRGS